MMKYLRCLLVLIVASGIGGSVAVAEQQPDPQLCNAAIGIIQVQRDRANNEVVNATAQANLLSQKNAALEKENAALKQQIDDLKKPAAAEPK